MEGDLLGSFHTPVELLFHHVMLGQDICGSKIWQCVGYMTLMWHITSCLRVWYKLWDVYLKIQVLSIYPIQYSCVIIL